MPETYDPTTQYRVLLTAPVKIFGATLYPLDPHEMPGSTILKIITENGEDVIASAITLG